MEKNTELNQVIKNLQRCLKNRTSITKFIKKLRHWGKLDILIQINGETEINLLMHCCRDNLLAEVKELLTGRIAADPTIVNKTGFNALMLAIIAAYDNPNYKTEIIDELLKIQPEKQLAINISQGNPLYFAVMLERLDIAKKISQINFPAMLLSTDNMSRETVLHLAIQKGYLDFAKELLTCQPEQQVLQADNDGIIPLHLALEKGELLFAQYLLSFVPDQQIQKRTNEHETVFDFAAKSKKLPLIAWLITTYPQVLQLRSINGFTPLHRACKEHRLALVKLLLENNPVAQVTALDEAGGIPLFCACLANKPEVVELLLQYDPASQLKTYTKMLGNIFHHMLTLSGDPSLLKLVINIAAKHNIDLKPLLLQSNVIELNPLAMIIGSPLIKEEIKNTLCHILLDIDNEQQLEKCSTKEGCTPLMLAIDANNMSIIELLVLQPSKQQFVIPDKAGNTPILKAIVKGSEAIVALLLKYGPANQFDLPKAIQTNPLAIVTMLTQPAMLRLLLPYCTEEQFNTARLMNVPLLHFATLDIQIVELILASGLVKHSLDAIEPTFGGTALHAAINKNQQQIALKLIAYGANINVTDFKGWAPIHVVCERNNLPLFDELIAKKADLNLNLKNGLTLLHIAARHGNLTIAKALLNMNPLLLDGQTTQGLTPLCFAAIYNHKPLMAELLNHSANANCVIDMQTQKLPLFLISFQLLNYEAMRLLLKQIDLETMIFLNDKQITIKQFLQAIHDNKPRHYEQLRKKIPGLPLFEKRPALQAANHDDSFITVNQKGAFNPREYLLAMGLTREEVETWCDELKQKRKALKASNQSSEFFATKNTETTQPITWLNHLIDSAHPAVKPIIATGAVNMYCYLDTTNLVEQGCDESKLFKKRFKFDGIHIKKLDDNKKIYEEMIKVAPSAEPRLIRYTHELKLNKLDRILLFKLDSDTHHGSLYIGLRYLPGGLHSQSQIKALLNQLHQEQNKTLTVSWPKLENQSTPQLKN